MRKCRQKWFSPTLNRPTRKISWENRIFSLFSIIIFCRNFYSSMCELQSIYYVFSGASDYVYSSSASTLASIKFITSCQRFMQSSRKVRRRWRGATVSRDWPSPRNEKEKKGKIAERYVYVLGARRNVGENRVPMKSGCQKLLRKFTFGGRLPHLKSDDVTRKT